MVRREDAVQAVGGEGSACWPRVKGQWAPGQLSRVKGQWSMAALVNGQKAVLAESCEEVLWLHTERRATLMFEEKMSNVQ